MRKAKSPDFTNTYYHPIRMKNPELPLPPNNVIVKHVDRRLRGRDEKGQVVYSPDFTNTYYHPIRSHIARKNPVFDGSVQVDRTFYERLTYGPQLEISSFDFNLNIV